MLQELKANLEQSANVLIPEWKTLTKNELLNAYVDAKTTQEKEGYLSAIFLNYWTYLNRCYRKVYKTASAEDCYDMLVDSALYVLKKVPWRNPQNKLYNDPNGPDKAMNVALSSAVHVYYQFSNTQKRRANVAAISLEYLSDVCGDAAVKHYSETTYDDYDLVVDTLVKDNFNKKNYVAAFVIDGTAYGDCFKHTHDEKGYILSEFSKRALMKHLRSLDSAYVANFAKKYEVDYAKAKEAAEICTSLSSSRLDTLVRKTFESIKHSKYAGGLLC